MRRGRIFIFLALILIIGLAIVAFVFRQFLPAPIGGATDVPPDGTQPGMTVEVYVAGQYIPQGGDITDDVITPTRIPIENEMDVMFNVGEKERLLELTARYPIEQGVFITEAMVGEGKSGPEWASEKNIPNGQVAIAIPTSRLESAAFGVQEGAHVDISACLFFLDVDPSFQTKLPNNVDVLTGPANVTPEEQAGLTLGVSGSAQQGRTEVESAFQQGIYVVPSEAQRPRLVCQNIVQNALVLKLGSFPLPGTPAIAEQPGVEEAGVASQAQEIPDIVTLVVLPQESVTLSYLVYSGAKITLSLRNNLDGSRTATEAATLQFLLSQYNIPVPAKLPYAMDPRVDDFVSPASSSGETTTTIE